MPEAILRENRNCWKIADASRAKFLVDGAAYFSALADALDQARESVLILGWDFDSRIRLKYERERLDDFPSLGEYLNSLASGRPTLNIHVLVWDFALIYALDREPTRFLARLASSSPHSSSLRWRPSDRRVPSCENRRHRRQHGICRRLGLGQRTLGHAGASIGRTNAVRALWSFFAAAP